MSKLPIVERLRELAAMLVHADALSIKPKAPNEVETTCITTTESRILWSALSEAATTITELVSALKDAPEPYEYMSKADFASLPYPMRSFVDAHKTWLRKVDTALSNTRGDTKNDKG